MIDVVNPTAVLGLARRQTIVSSSKRQKNRFPDESGERFLVYVA